jgi:hypothetical protein
LHTTTSTETSNYYLLIHELAHNTLHNNDHLNKIFYETVNELGARLTALALAKPELFKKLNVFVPVLAMQASAATANNEK